MKSFSIRVPGKAYLFGEYAVLFGEPALVAAVGAYLELCGERRRDGRVVWRDRLSGEEVPLSSKEAARRFPFLTSALDAFEEAHHVSKGLTFSFSGELAPELGLGSSAACTVALLAGLARTEGKRLSRRKLFELALAAQRRVQPLNSGGDVAACVYGGVLCYQTAFQGKSFRLRRLDAPYRLDLFHTGRSAPTDPLVRRTLRSLRSRRGEALRWMMIALARYGAAAWSTGDAELMGRLFLAYHLAMQSLGLVPPQAGELHRLIGEISHGAKMSGAGGGDCLVAIGARRPLPESLKRRHLPYRLGAAGVEGEEA